MLPILLAALETEEEKEYFAAFYAANNKNLFRYAMTFLHQPNKAEDALQEMWMRCFRRPEQFFAVPPEKQLAWLTVVLKRVCLNHLRQEARYAEPEEDWDAATEDPGHYRDIVDLIRAMPETYRGVLELKFIHEWSDREIADFMGLSYNAVATRISRGRKILMKKLIEEGYYVE